MHFCEVVEKEKTLTVVQKRLITDERQIATTYTQSQDCYPHRDPFDKKP